MPELALIDFARLAERFQGVSLDYRRDGTEWPMPWRARCFSAKHEGARHEAFGLTPEYAIAALVSAVAGAMELPRPKRRSAADDERR